MEQRTLHAGARCSDLKDPRVARWSTAISSQLSEGLGDGPRSGGGHVVGGAARRDAIPPALARRSRNGFAHHSRAPRCTGFDIDHERLDSRIQTLRQGCASKPEMPTALNNKRAVPHPARRLPHDNAYTGIWGSCADMELHGSTWRACQDHISRPHADRLRHRC